MRSIYVGYNNRMVRKHSENEDFDYMHRFDKIINKLEQL